MPEKPMTTAEDPVASPSGGPTLYDWVSYRIRWAFLLGIVLCCAFLLILVVTLLWISPR